MIEGAPINVRDYGAKGDGVTDDTAAIQAALDSLSEGETLTFPSAVYAVNGALVISGSSLGIHFDNCKFFVGDTGASATTVSGATGKVGFHFKSCSKLQITGSAIFIGQGTSGVTSLLGVLFDTCSDVLCPAEMRFETMAIGRTISSCTRCSFGNAHGNDMNGLQPFESPPTNNAGSVETVSGTSYSSFGTVIGFNNEKPTRYLSISSTGGDNAYCSFGDTVCDGVDVSPTTPQVLHLRSAVDCSFGAVIGTGVSQILAIQQYSGDEGKSVNRCYVSSVVGSTVSSASSSDTAIEMSTTSTETLGTVDIGSVNVTCNGEYGILCTNGVLNIGTVSITNNAGRPVWCSSSSGVGNVRLNIDSLTIEENNTSNSAVNIGQGVSFTASNISILKGPASTTTSAVIYQSGSGSGGFLPARIGTIMYEKNGSAGDYQYLVYDGTNTWENWAIYDIIGTGSFNQGFFVSNSTDVHRGKYYGNSAPSSGTFTANSILYDRTPSASGFIGWTCVTGGNPGTWKTFGAISA